MCLGKGSLGCEGGRGWDSKLVDQLLKGIESSRRSVHASADEEHRPLGGSHQLRGSFYIA